MNKRELWLCIQFSKKFPDSRAVHDFSWINHGGN